MAELIEGRCRTRVYVSAWQNRAQCARKAVEPNNSPIYCKQHAKMAVTRAEQIKQYRHLGDPSIAIAAKDGK